MTTRWARFALGWATAIVSTVGAALSHVAAGGGHPPYAAIAIAVAFSGMACVWLTGRRFSRFRLTIAVGISQSLYHGFFALFGTDAGGSLPGSGATYGHAHVTLLAPLGDAPASFPASADAAMFFGHSITGIATLLLMLYGEHVARGIAEAAVPVAASLWRVVALWRAGRQWRPRAAAVPAACRTELPPDLVALIGRLRHRGPPLMVARG